MWAAAAWCSRWPGWWRWCRSLAHTQACPVTGCRLSMLCAAPAQTHHTERKGNVLFNDALNTFYIRLYGVRHMVKDHSDSERGNLLPPHRLLFTINSKVFLYAPSHRQDSTYHGLCYTSRGALAGTRNSSMGPPHEGSIRRPNPPWVNARTTSHWKHTQDMHGIK